LHKFLTLGSLAPIQGAQTFIDAGVKFLETNSAETIMLFEQAQSFSNDLAGGIVPTRPDLSVD